LEPFRGQGVRSTVDSLLQAWGILEDREANVGVARVLFKRALRVDSQNVPTWMSWAAMEERQGNAVRADELRNLCLQQVLNNTNQQLQCFTVLPVLPVPLCINSLKKLNLGVSRKFSAINSLYFAADRDCGREPMGC
jgi:hypothetical protein